MVIPVGGRRMQDLLLIKKKKREIEEENLCPCSFLPLIGEEGWKESFLN
jgi:protein-L-isoaspartate(D-aspartate) O-methyltransferase